VLALARTDVSEELGASFIRVIDSCHPNEGGVTFLRNIVLTRATRRNIPEDAIPLESLYVFRREERERLSLFSPLDITHLYPCAVD
jgi:hypothetical protein